jgi:hypothetical protein
MSLPVQHIDWTTCRRSQGQAHRLLLEPGVGMPVEPEVKAAVEARQMVRRTGRDRRAGRSR